MEEELQKIQDVKVRSEVKRAMQKHGDVFVKDEQLHCETCINGWSNVPRLKKEPNSAHFKLNRNVCQTIDVHKKSQTHKDILIESIYLQEEQIKLAEIAQDERKRVYEMTKNVFRLVYFVLKEDISALKFEKICNLLTCMNALIGNQLHSKQTAATIALAIDEMWMKILVDYLRSDVCEFFGIQADELTDLGNMKTLLSKIRFIENGNVQEFVFTLFESTGDSENMYKKFLETILKTFGTEEDFDREEVMQLLKKKLVINFCD